MASLVLFSPLPSTAFLHKHSTMSTTSPFLCNFSPFSISISTSTKPTTAFSIRVRSFSTSAASVDVRLPDKTNGSDASTRKDHLDISKLGISDQIVSALSRRGITELFPIQRAVLEPAMEGRDMIGRAITGSGKTLAFGIPILDKIIRHHRHHRVVGKRVPSALILAPTRELARQVQKEFKESAPNLSSACLYGGIPIMNQKRMLGFGIDVVVGTPGRIIDLVERGALNLSEVKFVVLDEADQMLAIGFQENVECILSYLPTKKQFMLFSATMPSWVNELSRKYLRNPLVIDLVGDSDQKLAKGISLYSIVSTASSKPSILHTLISRHGQGGKTIIFTKTKKDAEELSRSMVGILGSRALHGNMQQFTRDKTIAAFRDGQFNVLVATDVAARGLDIPNVDLVIHFEIPNTSEIFVHRSGRTGRAGKNGTAILIFTESQRRAVRLIERDLNCKFEELPRLTVGVGNKNSKDMEGRHNGTYDNSERRPLGYSDRFATNRFGNSVGNRGQKYGNINESRGRRSTSFKQSGGRFGGHERSRKNHFSENPGGRNTQFLKYRSPQLPDYDERDDYYEDAMASDSESSGKHSRSASKHRFDGGRSFSSKKGHSISEGSIDFKQIIEALRDHS